MRPKFEIGKLIVSPDALDALIESGQDAEFFLQKHVSGDWGECDPEAQEQRLQERSSVIGLYRTLRGRVIVVCTFLSEGKTVLYAAPKASVVDAPSIYHGFTYRSYAATKREEDTGIPLAIAA